MSMEWNQDDNDFAAEERYHDETARQRDEWRREQQRRDREELEQRLTEILKAATLRRLTLSEVEWLCVGCGIKSADVI